MPLIGCEIKFQTFDNREWQATYGMTPARGAPLMRSMEIGRYRRRFPSNKEVIPPCDTYNCHGMTFASRRGWVATTEHRYTVDDLLASDGYQLVEQPEIGDLVIYRQPRAGRIVVDLADDAIDTSGEVLHSGLVADIKLADGGARTAIVWSKWGQLGEYLHAAEDCVEAQNGLKVEYWRTQWRRSVTI